MDYKNALKAMVAILFILLGYLVFGGVVYLTLSGGIYTAFSAFPVITVGIIYGTARFITIVCGVGLCLWKY